MFIVIGIGLSLAGFMNITAGEFGGWTVFGFLQVYWGVQEIRKFWKYASLEVPLEPSEETKEFEPLAVPPPEITAEELVKLKKLFGEDAVTFAYATETQWICVCGTRNPLDMTKEIQNCSQCHRNRNFALKNSGRQK